MKKIVSVLSVAALTLSTVFAADVSLNYKMSGALYSETNKKANDGNGNETPTQARTFLNLNGYAKNPTGDLAFTAKNDYAGFALTLNPQVGNAYTKFAVDTYYGWLNFSNVQVTSGKWSSRYVNRLDMHSGNWEGNEFERYKPGVVNGRIAFDVDNLTSVNKNKIYTVNEKTKEIEYQKADYETRLATAIAYTLHKDEDTALMFKGVLVDNKWGSTLRTDTKDDNKRAYFKKSYSDVDGGDLGFFSGFAGEFAYKTSVFDLNFVAKSMYRNQLAFGAFFRTIGENSSLLFGLSTGLDLQNTKENGETAVDHRYREFAFDFRGHFKLSEDLCLTTMNNLSVVDNEKIKDQKYDDTAFHLWDMASLAYKANEKVLLQFTVESECDLLKIYANHLGDNKKPTAASDGNELYGPSALGGFKFTVTPGVVYSFNENATLTTGVIVEVTEIGASRNFRDSQTTARETSSIKVPVVFKVAL